jgi:hypothetical protein
LLGPNSSRLNWDEISEVFQRTPNPELKFWYGGNDSMYTLKRRPQAIWNSISNYYSFEIG